MTTTKLNMITLLLLAAGAALAAPAWAEANRLPGAYLALLLALVWGVWLLGPMPRWRGVPTLCATLLILTGALALLWAEGALAGTLVFLSVVSTLAAWDLSGLLARLLRASVVQQESSLIAAHLRRLGAIVGLALLLGLAGPRLVPFGFAFNRMLLLAILLIVGLGRLLRRLQAAA